MWKKRPGGRQAERDQKGAGWGDENLEMRIPQTSYIARLAVTVGGDQQQQPRLCNGDGEEVRSMAAAAKMVTGGRVCVVVRRLSTAGPTTGGPVRLVLG